MKRGGRKTTKRKAKEPQPNQEEGAQVEEGMNPEQDEKVTGSDDEAPEEIPVEKVQTDFIPLKKKRRRSKKQPSAQESVAGNEQAVAISSQEKTEVKRREPTMFVEKIPGHYVGRQKYGQFHVVDLSSDANSCSSSQKQAIALKQNMFSRHRRRTGAQYLGLLQKSKMIGKV